MNILRINIIRCKKLAMTVSDRKYIRRHFVTQKHGSTVPQNNSCHKSAMNNVELSAGKSYALNYSEHFYCNWQKNLLIYLICIPFLPFLRQVHSIPNFTVLCIIRSNF